MNERSPQKLRLQVLSSGLVSMAVRLAGEGLLVEVSVEPRLTVDGARILLVTIQSDRTGAVWTARVALGHEVREATDVVEPTVLGAASRQDIFEVSTPNRSDREIRERSRSRDRSGSRDHNGMWGL